MTSERLYLNTHQPIDFKFTQNKFDFIVEELPLKPFKGKGNFFIMKIQKEYLSTIELVYHISKELGIDENLIGYAGLKDKYATTIQYISIPLNKSRGYKKIANKQINILETFLDDNKLRIGVLKGNSFKINLKEINPKDITQIYQNISKIQKHGMANYFGYQRFGRDMTFEKARQVVYSEERFNDKKVENLLISAYQSYFFNSWLRERILISKDKGTNTLISFEGDILSQKDKKTITGLLPGRKTIRAKGEARSIEKKYDDEFMHQKGFRRDAWIYPQNIQNKYDKEKNQMLLEFELPKSSYATVFIESLANKMIEIKK